MTYPLTASRARPTFTVSALCLAVLASATLGACSPQSTPAPAAPTPDATQSAPDATQQAQAPVQQQAAPAPAPQYSTSRATSRQPTYSPNNAQNGYANVQEYSPPDAQYTQYQQQAPVYSTYVDAPLSEPAPIAVQWAPPPLLVEEVGPQPYPDAVWTGGYWDWQGRWVWAAGRWTRPPRPNYAWRQPYYEHRNDNVVYVPGYWSPPEQGFRPPAAGIAIALAALAVGVIAGERANGPQGVFIPPPPGSRPGLIVPAPIGTAPAVLTSAPALLRPGMRVERGNNTVNNINNSRNSTVINNTTINNVTIVAPANATTNGQAFHAAVPAAAHLAAALPPQVRVMAPVPQSRTAIASYVPGRAPNLPAPQPVRGLQALSTPPAAAPGMRQLPPGETRPQPGQPAPAIQAAQQRQDERQGARAENQANRVAGQAPMVAPNGQRPGAPPQPGQRPGQPAIAAQQGIEPGQRPAPQAGMRPGERPAVNMPATRPGTPQTQAITRPGGTPMAAPGQPAPAAERPAPQSANRPPEPNENHATRPGTPPAAQVQAQQERAQQQAQQQQAQQQRAQQMQQAQRGAQAQQAERAQQAEQAQRGAQAQQAQHAQQAQQAEHAQQARSEAAPRPAPPKPAPQQQAKGEPPHPAEANHPAREGKPEERKPGAPAEQR